MDKSLFIKYLNSVTHFLKRDYEDKLVSIILFGSLVNANERITTSTDADLLVVLHDSCTSDDFLRIRRKLIQLERNSLPSIIDESNFIRGLQSATGMFCNFFICRVSDFKQRNFSKVFNVNSLMGAFLAPKNSVWLSLYRQYRVLWGENAFKEWQTIPIITKRDFFQSFLMNWFLATGALILYPINSQFAKFSMEAMKWSLFTWRNFYPQPLSSLSEVISRFISYTSVMELRALRLFMEYRKYKKSGKFFPILAWIFVVLLHRSLSRSMAGKSPGSWET
ncbi:MAG: hypothetical protein ACFFC6_06355 [Promethearchaeota archaeon]